MGATFAMLTAMTAGFLSLTCLDSRPEDVSTPLCYASSDGRLVRSTLRVTRESSGGEHLEGITEVRTHGIVRTVESASLDASGRLLHLDASVGRPGDQAIHVVLDPPSGRVDITTPSSHIAWSVPTDLPWVWAPMLTAPGNGRAITTPLDGRVVLRSAGSVPAVRLIDLGALASHAVMSDQLVLSDDGRKMVVSADDFIEIANEVPSVLHLGALRTVVEPVEERQAAFAFAAAGAGCAPSGRFQP